MPHAAAAAERQRSNGPKSEFLGKMDIRVHRTLNTGYYITWDSTWSSLFLHCTGAYLRGVVLQYKAEESVTLFPLCPPPPSNDASSCDDDDRRPPRLPPQCNKCLYARKGGKRDGRPAGGTCFLFPTIPSSSFTFF